MWGLTFWVLVIAMTVWVVQTTHYILMTHTKGQNFKITKVTYTDNHVEYYVEGLAAGKWRKVFVGTQRAHFEKEPIYYSTQGEALKALIIAKRAILRDKQVKNTTEFGADNPNPSATIT